MVHHLTELARLPSDDQNNRAIVKKRMFLDPPMTLTTNNYL